MRESLSDLAGGPVPDWSWKKASLPSLLGGLNIRSAELHAPAAFISSLVQSRQLVERIIGQPTSPSLHLPGAVAALSKAAAMPDWVLVEEIDIPLRQRALSKKIDEATFDSLLSSVPDTRARALAFSYLLVLECHLAILHQGKEFSLLIQGLLLARARTKPHGYS